MLKKNPRRRVSFPSSFSERFSILNFPAISSLLHKVFTRKIGAAKKMEVIMFSALQLLPIISPQILLYRGFFSKEDNNNQKASQRRFLKYSKDLTKALFVSAPTRLRKNLQGERTAARAWRKVRV